MTPFEPLNVSAFELEIQLTVENSSLQSQASKQVIKELGPLKKKYQKALEALDKNQKQEDNLLTKKIENQVSAVLKETEAKISNFQKKIEDLSKTISIQSKKIQEQKPPTVPIQPKRPGEF